MNNYISIKVVLDNLMHHPLLADLTFERAVHYSVDFLRLIGTPKLFINRVDKVKIEDYRGMLPCNTVNIEQVRLIDGRNTYHGVFRAATDTFHLSDTKHYPNDLTFKVQGGIIYTSIKEGTIEISYEAIATDDEGYPLIPDNSYFRRALELYIKKECFTILFDLGKINQQVYNNTLQEYAFAVASASHDLVIPTISEMEAITGIWNNLIPRVHEFRNGFVNTGTKERIKVK